MACCDLLLVRCRRLQRSAKCKYTHYRSTYCLGLKGADVTMWDSDPWKSRVWAFTRKREITGEPLNSRSLILAPNSREITGVDCIRLWCFFDDLLHKKWLEQVANFKEIWTIYVKRISFHFAPLNKSLFNSLAPGGFDYKSQISKFQR